MQALLEVSFPRVASCQCTLVLQRATGAGDTCRYVLVLPQGRPETFILAQTRAKLMFLGHLQAKECSCARARQSPTRAVCWARNELDG